MRKYILRLIFFFTIVVFGQNPEIKADMPNVMKPSPTVAALMKFEEVPVSNYTGIPDISIPILNVPSHSKDISLNVSLKYHSGVSANDIASDVGLGWSLFAGGTISRSVRGLPDEQIILATGQGNSGKVGVYHDDYPFHNNSYYFFNENVFDEDEYSFYNNQSLSAANQELINEFIWSSTQLGKFDTEHDLWQFNFMGHSGRFYIKKNTANNTFEVIPLDDYKLKIYYNYTTVGINNYVPQSFTIFDEKGFKYIFNIIETSKSFSSIESFAYGNTASDRTVTSEKDHISALHLHQIFDPNDILLVSFEYTDNNEIKESRKDFVEVTNEPIGNNSGTYVYYAINYPCMGEFPASKIYTSNSELIKVRKLTSINIVDNGIIEFDYGLGRQDTNIGLSGQAPYLKTITLKDLNQNTIKEFEFEYEYSTVLTKRMMLKSIMADNLEKHEFFYEQNDTDGNFVGKDYWGYLNLISPCRLVTTYNKEVSPSFSTTDLLQKIKFPTGGCAIFDFEPNSYSHIGSVGLTNFDENPDNFTLTSTQTLIFNNLTQSYNTNNSNGDAPMQLLEFSATENVKVKISSGLSYPIDFTDAKRSFKLTKLTNGIWGFANINLTCPYDRDNCCFDIILEAGVQYGIMRELHWWPYDGPNGDTITIEYFTKNSNQLEYIYGGGNRIEQIGYFDEETPANYFKSTGNPQIPKKLKKYNYNFFDNASKSSGSLVYSKPVYEFDSNFSVSTQCGLFQAELNGDLEYKSTSNKNFLTPLKTQGSDVGYKNVTVSEINNGKIQYNYYSPIDHPEQISTFIKPHIPSKNIDYKRGLIKEERIFNNERIISFSEYDYDFVEFEEQSGIKIFRYTNDPYFQGSCFNNYNSMKSLYTINNGIWEVEWSTTGGSPGWFIKSPINFHCGDPFTQRNFYIRPIKEAYGWAKLSSKTTKNYFYDQSNTPRIVETNETYQYNSENKMISESTVTNSVGEVLQTKYFYHTGNSTYSENRISEIERIETYRGSELLSTSQINYANNWAGNVSYLPQVITTSKGLASLENRVRFNLYDEYSNPLELQQENGTVVSYIWGYNKTQPIAKIENASNAQVSAALSVANLSTVTEASMTAINNLRSTLPNAMVTTYTYRPLVGVSTITDPKGDVITYEYDDFNRLKAVYDNSGHKLSQNDYHYRTQN